MPGSREGQHRFPVGHAFGSLDAENEENKLLPVLKLTTLAENVLTECKRFEDSLTLRYHMEAVMEYPVLPLPTILDMLWPNARQLRVDGYSYRRDGVVFIVTNSYSPLPVCTKRSI